MKHWSGPFEQVVFAGGGHRCWWQAGWWSIVAARLALRPRVIAGVSAGSATACLLYANDTRVALDYYRRVLADGSGSIRWRHALVTGQPLFPHETIYRAALRFLLGGEHFLRLKATAPEIRIQFAHPPRWLGPRSAVAVGLVCYNLEKYLRQPLHPLLGRRVGFRRGMVTAQSCASDDELVDLVIASSCTPPFTRLQYRQNLPTLDGGLVDNVPVDALDAVGVTTTPPLVLVTRRYKRYADVFEHEGRIYAQPSRPVAASSWDYTTPAAYEATFTQGREDGEQFLRWFDARAATATAA